MCVCVIVKTKHLQNSHTFSFTFWLIFYPKWKTRSNCPPSFCVLNHKLNRNLPNVSLFLPFGKSIILAQWIRFSTKTLGKSWLLPKAPSSYNLSKTVCKLNLSQALSVHSVAAICLHHNSRFLTLAKPGLSLIFQYVPL